MQIVKLFLIPSFNKTGFFNTAVNGTHAREK